MPNKCLKFLNVCLTPDFAGLSFTEMTGRERCYELNFHTDMIDYEIRRVGEKRETIFAAIFTCQY